MYLHDEIKSWQGYKPVGKNWVQNLIRAITIQRQEVSYNDLIYIAEKHKMFGVTIDYKWLPVSLNGSRMIFDPVKMFAWYKQGFDLDPNGEKEENS